MSSPQVNSHPRLGDRDQDAPRHRGPLTARHQPRMGRRTRRRPPCRARGGRSSVRLPALGTLAPASEVIVSAKEYNIDTTNGLAVAAPAMLTRPAAPARLGHGVVPTHGSAGDPVSWSAVDIPSCGVDRSGDETSARLCTIGPLRDQERHHR